jgi:predicted dinucleotide-binding enzyme
VTTEGEKMKIGILGSGDVGRTLGSGFVKYGHEVKLGTRDPESEKVIPWLKKTGPNATVGTMAETAANGNIIVLATLWTGTENALRLAKPEYLAGVDIIEDIFS